MFTVRASVCGRTHFQEPSFANTCRAATGWRNKMVRLPISECLLFKRQSTTFCHNLKPFDLPLQPDAT